MKNKDKVILEFLEFGLNSAQHLYRPDKPLEKNLCPTFYHTLTYEGDLALIEKTKLFEKVVKQYIEELRNENDNT